MKVKEYIDSFINEMNACKDKDGKVVIVNHRYRSFDFCYYYFRTMHGKLSNECNIENSCMHLWSYLASWGMLRGSKLMDKSPASLKELVKYIDKLDMNTWNIDVDNYSKNYSKNKSKNNIDKLYGIYSKICKQLVSIQVSPTITLVTKIMLGTMGNIPAFDRYFKLSFKIYINNEIIDKITFKKHLIKIMEFYDSNKDIIDSYNSNNNIPVLDFKGGKTSYCYTKAKLIDMYGFIDGMEKDKKNKEKNKNK